ncbi:alpha-L-arabinofuranosidase II precursor [Acetivibrio straminisolvens JCM 21531]|uniref:Alpha-L-arabinofuranosidase II n=1 Tax=Acetivibrio straminisolvens JCM 21531 TaxID=1294263 RepID=W4VAS6_9FIRM|nr:alpha-L-arabinofuranosidase II precursor [Acetivibrio straminisolvens JCM 21531]
MQPKNTFEEFEFPIGTKISDAISHPTEPVIFAADSANSKVYSVNVETGTVREVYIGGTIDKMAYFDNELFVTVLTNAYSPNSQPEGQSGVIAVIDTVAMELKEKIDIDIVPYDIVAGRDGYLYVTSGSEKLDYINSYSRSAKELADSELIRHMSLAEYHPALNRIYTIDEDVSPRDYKVYNIDNGKFVSYYDSIYHGDYSLDTYFKISPDGKYIFNGSGCIFTCTEDEKEDMRFFFKLDKEFNNIVFDLDHDLFFTSVGDMQIHVYDYNTLRRIKTVNSKGNVSKLLYAAGELIALYDDGKGGLALENIQISGIIDNLPVPIPTPAVTFIPIMSNEPSIRFDLDMEVKDSVIHPDKEFIYIINGSDELVKIDFETGEKVTVTLGYNSNCIAFGNGEIYVGFGSQGMIGIYNAETLQYEDRILVGDTFLDVAVGNDGYIYTSPNETGLKNCLLKSFSGETKQEVSASKLKRPEAGYLAANPVNNSLVFSSISVSPTDLYTIKYDNGIITETYDSPYHGEYRIASKNRISPDGLYIFNNSGNIFTASDNNTEDLRFYLKLNKSFNDVAFDIENDKFYVASSENTIYEYNYSTFTQIDTKYTEGTVKDMYFRDGYLIAVSKVANKRTILEKIRVWEGPVKSINLKNYRVGDSVIHGKKSLVYFVDDTNNKLVSVNYMAGEIKESEVTYSPNCVDIYNGEIYVGCGENKIIYIYDDNTLELKDWIMSGTTFEDLGIGNDGFIYILGGGYVRSFSRTLKQEISNMQVHFFGKMEKHPSRNAFYFTSQGVIPADIYAFEYENGSVVNVYNSPYHGEYSIGRINKISPDGKLLFNSSGNIFASGINPMYDIRYLSKLERSFTDACFDERSNLLFAAYSNNVDIYDYSTLTKLAGLSVGNIPSYVFYKSRTLFLLAPDSLETVTGEELDEIIPSNSEPTPAPGIMLPINAAISDAVEHPEKPVIFAVDAANSKVYSINIKTGEIKETLIDGAIERLDYQNGILYVTIFKKNQDSNLREFGQISAVVVIDADTMKIKKQFKLEIAPYDIVAGRDGIVYLTSHKDGWAVLASYSPDSEQVIETKLAYGMSFAELHPVLNRIYTIDTTVSPRDYTAFNIDNGKFVSSYDSPYHGQYKLATNYKISPDGKYLFNGCGAIFTCSESKTEDMNFARMLDKTFKDIAFNVEEKKFYITAGDNRIYVYNYEDFTEIKTVSSVGEISKLFYVGGKLCALSTSANGRPMIEVVEEVKIKYGDVNNDGKINSTDIMYLKGHLLRNSTYKLDEYGLLAADVDGDGSVTSLDLSYLKRYILRKISDFPANNK